MHKIRLERLILAMPDREVTFTDEMLALKQELHEAICATFTTWQGPAIKPLPKTTQKLCRVWRRVCWNEVHIF